MGIFDEERERKAEFNIPKVKCALPSLPKTRIAVVEPPPKSPAAKSKSKPTKSPTKSKKPTSKSSDPKDKSTSSGDKKTTRSA